MRQILTSDGMIYDEMGDGNRMIYRDHPLQKLIENQGQLRTWFNNIFRCHRCGSRHGWGTPDPADPTVLKDYPGIKLIQKEHQHLDCTAWACPGCGYWHDSRHIEGMGFLGVHGIHSYDPVTPMAPHTEIERVIRKGRPEQYRLVGIYQ